MSTRCMIAAVAMAGFGALSSACATAGDTLDSGDDTTGPGADGGVTAGGGDAGTPTGPAALGVGIFSAQCNPGSPSVPFSPVRRISRIEYDNMVRDLLGDTTAPATAFVSESPLSTGINFNANTYTGVGATDTVIPQQYLTAAETLAATAVGTANALTTLFDTNGVNSACSTQNDACAQAFINAFANSAFRGQFDAAEGTSLFQNVYTPVKTQFDFPTGIQAIITAVLTSPRFLYVLEFGQTGGSGSVVALSSTELATRLALFLWRSVPDATLLQAATSGQLATPAQITQQATRMLADKKAFQALDDFAAQWMEITNASTLTRDSQYTTWNGNTGLAAELEGETLATYHFGVLNGDTLTDLLSSPSSYVNTDVASFYAGSTSVSGAKTDPTDPTVYTKQMVSSAANPRAGILTDAIVLAGQSHTSFPSPTLRGKLVREQVMCDPINPPPAGLVIGPPPASVPAGQSVKDQYAAHTVPGSVCANCHDQMDPVGDAFGVYDATGIYQTVDSDGRPTSAGPFPAIDPTGQVAAYATTDPVTGKILSVSSTEFTATFTGPTDLATQLANATQSRQCFALQTFRYSLSRVESAADVCSLQSVFQTFSSNSFTLQDALLGVVQSDAFRYRTVETAGSACQ